MGLSLHPDKMTEGGGGIQGVFTVKRAWTDTFNYQGKGEPVPVIKMEVEDCEGDVVTQVWSVGKITDWLPNDEMTSFDPVGGNTKTGLNKQSNGGILLVSLYEAGIDGNILESGDISKLTGMKAEFQPKVIERKGLQSDRKFSVPVVVDILEQPGGAKAKSKSMSKSSDKSANKAESNGALTARVEEILEDYLKENETVRISQIPTVLYEALAGDEDEAEALEIAKDSDFLKSQDRPWQVKGGKLSLVD